MRIYEKQHPVFFTYVQYGVLKYVDKGGQGVLDYVSPLYMFSI